MACKPDIPVGVILSDPADFTAWKFKLECVLSTRDCLSCLTEEPGEAASAAAIKKDQLARSIIGMNIANHTVKNLKTAKAQLDALAAKVQPKTEVHIHSLLVQLA